MKIHSQVFQISTALVLGLGASLAMAEVTCAGLTHSNRYVEVNIRTVGTMGSVVGGEVKVVDQTKNSVEANYLIDKEKIMQFSEACRDDNCNTAAIGLGAYIELNHEVSINFVGQNHPHPESLESTLKDPARIRDTGNAMRVFDPIRTNLSEDGSAKFFEFKDVVCSLSLDV